MGRGRAEIVDLDLYFIREQDKSWVVSDGSFDWITMNGIKVKRVKWKFLPKSLVEIEIFHSKKGFLENLHVKECVVTLPRWLAENEGLV